ncbi:MAG: hypothetical protein A3F46_01405 [Legionellales bacterium RIFCSPHIGHO2_12_FULL_42_9]|nr:MAG: hypothetical protein A3F46_01405 [Legionellales bacterium RIFCSPHIGHO2_12_FULL_42_9]
MAQIIDRRQNDSKKNLVNRQRFLRRYRAHIKQAVSDSISKRGIAEIDTDEQINIPAKDTSEPHFQFDNGGFVERVFPGNNHFVTGDRIPRPDTSGSNGAAGSATNQSVVGEDDFVFTLSKEEFLELYFEDLELPDLIRKELALTMSYKIVRTGITTSGNPTNMNIVRSMRQAASRRIALGTGTKRKLHQAQLDYLMRVLLLCFAGLYSDIDQQGLLILTQRIAYLQKKRHALPFLDTLDLRYNNHLQVQTPTTTAVMFCIMDVSGSMDAAKKDIAKRFFILLYLFLTKNYTKIELVFIRHHTSAKEVTEDDFFYSRETGGTVVSSALELLYATIIARYPVGSWNIYVAQASDGDNWNADSPYCQELLHNKIMPLLQYFAYIEIMPRHHQSLWDVYQQVNQQHRNFAIQNIDNVNDIYSVFRELFKKKQTI